ncbi:uncharacterized protein LOC119398051 [Rhipicephalus sanguineus]|uniref:uncharacterized protein LOC119398051 n=1 Tax=Rhipicephalus sanguineus TaxID=34632 RepID=UPI00189472D0|nr:uncharacterized protein LOC119398051 [Rhipicephalus sanguineus]
MSPHHACVLLFILFLAGAQGFSFGGQKDEDFVEDPLIEEEDEEERPNEKTPDMPPWYSSKGYPYDYGMGEELGNMFGSHNEDLFKDKEYLFEEPKKTFEEIYEEVFRFHDLDKDDALTPEEVRRALLHSKIDIVDAAGNDLVDDALAYDDKDKDGMLSLEEFLLSQKTNMSGLKSLGELEL